MTPHLSRNTTYRMIRITLLIFALLFVLFTPLLIAQPASTDKPVRITVRTVEGLRYDTARFEVAAGVPVELTLINDDQMLHNLLITTPGKRMEVVTAAVALGPAGLEKHFVPDSPEVLHHTRMLNPTERQTLAFNSPDEPGVYPYVCTFPGHGFVMYGAMYVETAMPPLDDDANIPPRVQVALEGDGSQAPFPPVRPFTQRILMPNASPAAIAVALPGDLNYCWDAGPCRLRYAWRGEFIDPYTHWSGAGDGYAAVRGDIFYQTADPPSELATVIGSADEPQRVFAHRATPDPGFPLRLDSPDHIPKIAFRGYRLTEDGSPEFRYTIDGVEVFERIAAVRISGGWGLAQRFRIPGLDRSIYYLRTDSLRGDRLTTSAGAFRERVLELPASQGRDFTLTIVPEGSNTNR